MKITVLDRCTVTAGDLSFAPLDAVGDVSYYDLLPPERIADAIGDSDAVIVNKAKITDEIIQGLNSEEDEHLITVKISDLIRANVTEEVTEEKIRAVATVFIQTYRDLAVNKKSV